MIRRSQTGDILGKNFQAERATGMKAQDGRGVALNLEGRSCMAPKDSSSITIRSLMQLVLLDIYWLPLEISRHWCMSL